MRAPGFEPELQTWQACVITRLHYARSDASVLASVFYGDGTVPDGNGVHAVQRERDSTSSPSSPGVDPGDPWPRSLRSRAPGLLTRGDPERHAILARPWPAGLRERPPRKGGMPRAAPGPKLRPTRCP